MKVRTPLLNRCIQVRAAIDLVSGEIVKHETACNLRYCAVDSGDRRRSAHAAIAVFCAAVESEIRSIHPHVFEDGLIGSAGKGACVIRLNPVSKQGFICRHVVRVPDQEARVASRMHRQGEIPDV